MGIKDKLMSLFKEDEMYKIYGNNVHDIGLEETIQTGIVDKLMNARKLGISYCVVFGNVTPLTTQWDKYGDGRWNPPKDYIGTEDIATENNDREQELKNIYAYLRGEEIVKNNNRTK